MYICARCTGIVIGVIAGLAYVNILAELFFQYPILVIVFTLPATIDWLVQIIKGKESTNSRRLLTGALIGQTYLVGLIALVRGWIPLLEFYMITFAAYGVALYAIFRKSGVMNDYLASAWPV